MFALATFRGRRVVLAALVCAGMMTAQTPPAPATQPPAAPQVQDNTPSQRENQPQLPASPALAPVDPTTYRLGANDVVHVEVWREGDFTRTLAVRPDGKITMPILGDIPVVGMTPDDLAKDLTKRLTTLINNPQVNVSVVSVRSKRYFITGEAGRVGEFPLVKKTTVMEALTMAGGFRPFANRKKVIILRGDQQFFFNYNDYIKGKNHDKNLEIQDGDYIIVK